MKKTALFIIVFALTFAASRPVHAAKWKGNWYLRGQTECKEVNLDRKGRTTMGVYPKAIVEKQDKEFYLTVESMGKKYSYKMNPIDTLNYELELISVGPNLPVPEGSKSVQDAYTGFFRKMVDCQTTMPGYITETQTK